MIDRIAVKSFENTKHDLLFTITYNDREFPLAYRYDDSVNFPELEEQYGKDFMDKIYFHIIAFEINKLAGLKPDELDWGPFKKFVTPEFEALWREVFKNVWGEWRYKNDFPDYEGPKFTSKPVKSSSLPKALPAGKVETLLSCSSGKDSLACLTLLQNGEVPFDTLSYSINQYGRHEDQRAAADRVIDTSSPSHRRYLGMDDTIMNSKILEYPEIIAKGITMLTQGETPSAIFGSLPYALAHNYHYLALGHERSANAPQVYWGKTEEGLNHQWGKSFAAETLINTYMRKNLITNYGCFSLLQPIHDGVIFSILNDKPDAIKATNSCNNDLDGCEKCAKCCYVNLGFGAFLPKEVVDAKYRTNLFNNTDNTDNYAELLAEGQRPWECVGERPETNLFFALCAANGYEGEAINRYLNSGIAGEIDHDTIEEYLSVHLEQHNIPPDIAKKVLPLMEVAAARAREAVHDIRNKSGISTHADRVPRIDLLNPRSGLSPGR